jgi:hypothetical protein
MAIKRAIKNAGIYKSFWHLKNYLLPFGEKLSINVEAKLVVWRSHMDYQVPMKTLSPERDR